MEIRKLGNSGLIFGVSGLVRGPLIVDTTRVNLMMRYNVVLT